MPLVASAGLFGRTFGFFILSVAAYAVVTTFAFLVPALMVVGPEGKQGSLTACCERGSVKTRAAPLEGVAPPEGEGAAGLEEGKPVRTPPAAREA
mmetsp:Transcript_25334/g.84923  ORF Transcript_25334/g.84923 Transcript_25334/m.84923 type:complete len:95 (-) Transcript_25334:18-302(-)